LSLLLSFFTLISYSRHLVILGAAPGSRVRSTIDTVTSNVCRSLLPHPNPLLSIGEGAKAVEITVRRIRGSRCCAQDDKVGKIKNPAKAELFIRIIRKEYYSVKLRGFAPHKPRLTRTTDPSHKVF